jgi:hypothetical protein
MALEQLGNDIASTFLGMLTGFISEWMTDRIRIHRSELGAPDTGAGSGKMETLTDLSLDSLTQIVFLLLGIKMTERAVPAVTGDLSAMILYIIGVSTQTTLPKNLNRLMVTVMQTPDPLVVANTSSA